MISCEPIYTGGGIYCFRGQLSETEWFVADDDFYDVRIVDSTPWEIDKYGDEVCWFSDWQEEHLVRDLDGKESFAFFRKMINWIKANKPKGNYAMYDLEDDLAELNVLEKHKNWR